MEKDLVVFEVLDSCGGLCVLCDNYANAMHHIVPRSLAPDRVLDPKNMAPLCHACHHKVHVSGDIMKWASLIIIKKARLQEVFGDTKEGNVGTAPKIEAVTVCN